MADFDPYSIGAKFRVVDNRTSHPFEVGEIVTLSGRDRDGDAMFDGDSEEGWWCAPSELVELEPAYPYACAECGTKTATTYVVTTLDYDNPEETRTEVCLPCHEEITKGDTS